MSDDVINDEITITLEGHNCIFRIHSWTKFHPSILFRFRGIVKNVIILVRKEYRRPTLRSCCDVTNDVIDMENIFSGIIEDELFISKAEWKLC